MDGEAAPKYDEQELRVTLQQDEKLAKELIASNLCRV